MDYIISVVKKLVSVGLIAMAFGGLSLQGQDHITSPIDQFGH
ncbi:uncharacterized protein METZ01_LOCUS505061, partial [marine metagenome]